MILKLQHQILKITQNEGLKIKLAWLIFALAFLIGFLTRIVLIFYYSTDTYQGDQARDSFVYHQMMNGDFPGTGPGSSVGGFGLPPLYYYLTFAMSFYSKEPVAQAFNNALFSFLSIFLFGYFLYLLFNNLKNSTRYLISALGMFWWSILFSDVVFANMQWNPNSIPFFLLSYLLVQYKIVGTNKTKQLYLWFILLAIIAATLSNLHSATLLTIPIALGIYLLFFFLKRKDIITKHKVLLILTLLGVFIFLHTPYIVRELLNNFGNTKAFVKTFINTDSDGSQRPILLRLDRIVFNYLNLGHTLFFPYKDYYINITNFFLILSGYLGFKNFKGNKSLFNLYLVVIIIFYIISSNYWGIYHVHYQLLLWHLPLVLFFLCLFMSKKLN